MSSLVLQALGGSPVEKSLLTDVTLGSDPSNDLVLPGTPARQALITRSSVYRRSLILDLTGGVCPPRVNGRRIASLKVLRQLDEIRAGEHKLVFWELVVQNVTEGSRFLRQRCLVCFDHFRVGEQVILCPSCGAEHHKDDWFLLRHCTREGCAYPVRDSLIRSLSGRVRFEKLDAHSDLVTGRKTCSARMARDQGPFKDGDTFVACPNPECQAPFHAECWMRLKYCPSCNFDVGRLIEAALTPGRNSNGDSP